MTFFQVKDVLRQTSAYHEKLAAFYSGVARASAREPVKLLAGLLAGKQKTLSKSILTFLDSDPSILNQSWIQYSPAYDLERVIHSLRPAGDWDFDRLADAGIELNRRLIKYYGRLASIAPTEALADLFTALESGQRDAQKEISNILQSV